jgi:plastocyanin
MRLGGLLVLTVCAALALLAGAATAPAQAVKLVGTVGPGFSITLEFADGRTVTQIDPGTYEITVRDLSDEHNFRLVGPGVEQFTQVETTSTVTWAVTFREGRYTIQCDPHPTQMVRVFTVGNPPPVPVPKPPAPTPKLLATVGPKNTISLRSASGAALNRGVKAGSYAVVVRDRSKLHNFHLVGQGVNRKSTVAGVGTMTWKLKLVKGSLRFYSDKAPKTLKGLIKVV